MTHIFPPGEDHLHEMSLQCPCDPINELMCFDKVSKELVVTHLPLTFNLEVLPEQPKEMDSLFG